MAGKMDLSNPNVQKKIVIVLFLGIFLFVIYYFLIKPQGDEIKRLKGEISSVEKQVAHLKSLKRKLPKMKKELENKKVEAAIIKKSLPSAPEVPELLREITYAARNADIALISFVPGKIKRMKEYSELDVKLKLKGTYHTLGYFLSRLGQLQRIVNTGDVSIKKINSGNKKESYTIDVSMNVVAYLYDGNAKNRKKGRRRR